jgi:hypothetical protein
MDAQALLSVDTDTLFALMVHLRDTGSHLSPPQAATLAIRAWLADNAFAANKLPADPLAPSALSDGALTDEAMTDNALIDNALIDDALLGNALADNALATTSRRGRESPLNAAGVRTHMDNALANDCCPQLRQTSAPSPSTATGSARGYQWKELFLPDGTDVRMRCGGDVHHARVSGDAIVYQGHRVSPRQLTLAIAGDGRNAWRDLSLRLPGEKRFQPASLLRHRARAGIEPAEKAAPESPAATIAAAAASMSEALRTALHLVEHSTAQSLPRYERRVESHRRAADVLTGHASFD